MVLALAHAPIFGWAKPVPVVADRMRNPRRDMALVALAGPASNLVLATIAALVLGVVAAWNGGGLPATGVAGFVIDNLVNFLLINVFLAIFNLLPVPPFDGGHVVEALLPRALADAICQAPPLRLPGDAVPAGHPADDRAEREHRRAGGRADRRYDRSRVAGLFGRADLIFSAGSGDRRTWSR